VGRWNKYFGGSTQTYANELVWKYVKEMRNAWFFDLSLLVVPATELGKTYREKQIFLKGGR
jgi:hypothetical protein